MRTKKPQRRYTSEREIYAEIYGTQRKMNAKIKEAEELEDEGHRLVRTGHPERVPDGQHKLDKAARIRRSVKKVENGKLVKLKNALSAFKTDLLPGMGSDTAVVLEEL